MMGIEKATETGTMYEENRVGLAVVVGDRGLTESVGSHEQSSEGDQRSPHLMGG